MEPFASTCGRWSSSRSARSLCGVATTSGQLIAFRALQGAGGGLLAPTGMTILVKAVGRDNLPRVMSVIGVPMVLAPVFGPTLGGFLLQSVSWHAIFLINLPVGIATGIVAVRMLPRDQAGARRRRAAGLARAASRRSGYGRRHLRTLAECVDGYLRLRFGDRADWCSDASCVLAFVLRSRRISYPLLDLRLYAIRAYSAATGVLFLPGRSAVRGHAPAAVVLPGRSRRRRPAHRPPADPSGPRRGGGDEPLRAC